LLYKSIQRAKLGIFFYILKILHLFFVFQPRVLRKGIDFRVKKQTTNAKRFLRLASEKHEND